jgi:hypothetical protein
MERKRNQLYTWLKSKWDIAQLQGLAWDKPEDVLEGRDIDIALVYVENDGHVF